MEKKKRPRIKKAEGKKDTMYSTKTPKLMILSPDPVEYNGRPIKQKVWLIE